MRALGINIFGGGFTLGVLQSKKFEVVAQLEQCNAGKRTYDMNPQYFGNIPRPLSPADWPIAKWRGELDFVYANPPCAPWSACNTQKGVLIAERFKDPRLAMTRLTVDAALRLRPDVFVLESVARAFTSGRSYYDALAALFIKEKYAVTYFLTNGLLHGLPGTRERFHFIAHRYILPFRKPSMNNFMPRTVRMAIEDLQNKYGHVAQHEKRKDIDKETFYVMQQAYEGGQLEEVQKRLKFFKPHKFGFVSRRLIWDAPAFTTVRITETVHPNGTRWLTLREGLRLCGYPDDFCAADQKEVTQAVLPPMGKYLATLTAEAISNGEKAKLTPNVAVVDWRALARPYEPSAVLKQMIADGLVPERYYGK